MRATRGKSRSTNLKPDLRIESYKTNNKNLSFESLVGNVEINQIPRLVGVVGIALVFAVAAVMIVSILLSLASPGPFSHVIGAIEEYGGLALTFAVPGAFIVAFIILQFVGGDDF